MVIEYYGDGRLMSERCTVSGLREGPSRSFYPQGQPKSSGLYSDGKLNGHWTRWYESGGKRDEGDWDLGKPKGIWQTWYAQGHLKSKVRFEAGRPACGGEYWNERGEIVSPEPTNCSTTLKTPLNSWWDHFEISGVAIFQNSGGQSYSPALAWLPTMILGDRFALALDLDLTIIKSDANSFPALAVPLFISYRTQLWGVALGAGTESWLISKGGTAPRFGIKLMRYRGLSWLNYFYAGYSYFALPAEDSSHELRLGVGLEL